MGQFKDPELALAKEVILQAQAQTTKWVTITLVLSCVGVLGVTGIMMGVYLSGNLGKGDDSDDMVNLPVVSQAMKGANLESDVAQNHLDPSLSDPIKAPKQLHTTKHSSDDDDDQNSLSNLNKLNAKEIDKGFLASGMNHLNMIGKEMLMLPHLTRKADAKPIILPPSTIKGDITTSLPVEKLTVPAYTAPMPNAVTFDTTIRDFTISSNINSITNNVLGNVPNTLQDSFFQQHSPNDYDDNSYEFESKEETDQTEEDSNQEMSSEDNTSEETTSRETLGTDKDESSLKEQVYSGVISSETQIDEQSSTENPKDKSSSEEQTAEDSMEKDTSADQTMATDSKSLENQSKDEQSEESKEKDSSSKESSNEKQISKETNDNSHMFEKKDISADDNGGSNEVEIIKQAELDYDDSYEFEHILNDDKFKPFVATSLTLPEKIKSKEPTETPESNAISVENDKFSSHDSYDSDEQNSAARSVGTEGKNANADTSNSYEFNSAEASDSGDHSSEILIEVLKNGNSKQEDSVTIKDSENVSDKVRLSLGNNLGRYSYEEINSKSDSDESVVTEQINDKSQHDSAESTIENKSKESEKSSEELQGDTSSESNEDSESKENSPENKSNDIDSNSKLEKSSETEESNEISEVSTFTKSSKSDEDSSIKVNSNKNSIESSAISQDEHVNSDSDDKSSLIESESEESKENSEQDSKENNRDNVDNSSNNPSSDGSNNDEQTEESSEYFEHQQTSKQSESGDSSLVINVKETDDSSEEKNSNDESTEDIDDNSKADQTSIENLGKDVISESETSESSNNDDTSTESGEDSMLNIVRNTENKSSNDKSQLDDSNENDSNDESKSKESVSSELSAAAQQIQSSSLESKEKGDEGSFEENSVNSSGQDSKINSNDLGSYQSEKDDSSESEDNSEKQRDNNSSKNLSKDSEEKSNENSESLNYDNSDETSDESMDISGSESNDVSNENSEISHASDINRDQSDSDENLSERRDQDSSEHSRDISNNVPSLKSKETDKNKKQHRSSEQDGSSQHADKDDSSQHSEQNDLSQESDQEDRSQLLTQDKSNEHSEHDDSNEESKQDDPRQRSEQDDSSQHSKQDDSSQESDHEASSQLLKQDKSNQHSEQNESSQESEQDERSEKSTENMAANHPESSEHNEKDESSEENTDEGKVDNLSDDTSDEANKSKNPDRSVSKENLKISSEDSTKSDESTEENRAYYDASASNTDANNVDYNYPNLYTTQYPDLYSSFYYYDDLVKTVNNNKNSKETPDSDNTKVSAEVDFSPDDSGEKPRESEESNDISIQNEVKRPSSKQGSDETVIETAGTPLKDSGEYYDDNMYFDFLSGLLIKSRVNDDKNQQRSSVVSNDEHQASNERTGNTNNDDSKEDAPIRTDSRDDRTEIQNSNAGNGAIYTNPWATEQHSRRDDTDDAMSQFFNFAVTRNPMENGVIHGITNGFNSIMTTARPVVPAADYEDDDEDSHRGRSFGFVGATDDQRGGISSLHNGHVQDNTFTHNQHFSLNNNNGHTGSFGSDMFSGNQNFGHFDPFERTNIQQNIPSLSNDQSFSFSGLNQQPENGGSYNGHSQHDNQWPTQGNNFQVNWNQNLHQIGAQQLNQHNTGNEQSRTVSSPATENSLQTNFLSATGFDLLSGSPSATGSGLSPSISSHTSNERLPSSSFTPQDTESEHWSTGDMQASPIEASRQDRNIFFDPQTNYFSNSVHRNAFGAPNDQLDFNINVINGNNQMAGNQQAINNRPVVHDQQFYGDNNQFSVQSGNGASFGMVQNIPTSSQQVHVTNEDSDERDDETSSGLHKSSLSSIVQPSNIYRNPYADDNSDDHHESHQYANHNQGRSNDENDDSSENDNENEDDTDR